MCPSLRTVRSSAKPTRSLFVRRARMQKAVCRASVNSGGSDGHRRHRRPLGDVMSQTASTLLLRNLHDVFGEIDPVRRRAAIDEIFHEDAVFYEPNGTQATTDLGRLDRGRTMPCLERSSCTDRAFEPLRCEKSRPPHL